MNHQTDKQISVLTEERKREIAAKMFYIIWDLSLHMKMFEVKRYIESQINSVSRRVQITKEEMQCFLKGIPE